MLILNGIERLEKVQKLNFWEADVNPQWNWKASSNRIFNKTVGVNPQWNWKFALPCLSLDT